MIEFKKNIEKILPYNKEQYFDFLDDDLDIVSDWHGVSIQIADGKTEIDINIDRYIEIFKTIILKLDKDLPWIINHYYKDMNWFPNDNDNLNSFRTLFKENNIPNTFKGSIIFMKDDLMKFAKDLIMYPYVLSYRDLDISHSVIPFIIKITNHLTIDLISTDKTTLKLIVDNVFSKDITIKEYREISL